jgi:hypothetical protein
MRSKQCLHHGHKLLVVSDDDELEIALLGTRSNDLTQSDGKATLVMKVEICGRLVKGNATAVDAECLGKRQSNDDAGENTLARVALATHVQLRASFRHDLWKQKECE